jgi:hypothetical protein
MGVEGAALSTKQPDLNVQVPAAVRQAAERSNELVRQAAEAKKNAPPNADAPVVVALTPPPANPGVTMARFDPNNPQPPMEPQRPQPQQQQPRQQSPQPQAQLQPQQQQPQPQAQQQQETGDWEHQFKSLKGRYDRTEQDNKRLAGQIGDMQRLIAAISAPPAPQPQAQQQQEGSGVRFSGPITGRPKRVTEKEISDYGSDLIDVMGRRAMEVQDSTLLPELHALRNELNFVKQQVGGVRQTVEYDAQSRMYNQLDRELPSWKQVNSSPEFVNWLQMPDPLSGQIRHNLLAEAYNSQQGNRVMEFFRRFLTDQASYGPANGGLQPGNGALTAGSYATTPQVDLLSLAAPGRAKVGQTQVTPDKPTFTVAEIKQFYTDSANGKYAGREQEYNNIQQEIFAAGREGRVAR